MATEVKTSDQSPVRSPRLAPQVGRVLANLRRRLFAYVWTEGLAASVAWLGAAFWVSLVLDWWLEPPAIVRQIALGLVAIGLVVVLYRFIIRRLLVRIADRSLALLLERRFSRLDDSLLTAVEMGEEPGHAASFDRNLLAQTQTEAIDRLANVRVADVFRRGPLVRCLLGAAASIISIAALVIFAPSICRTWTQRELLFSDVRWPRRTHLEIEGFADHHLKIAKGSDVTIVVKADAQHGSEVPENVQIRYRTEEGRSRENMSRIGEAGPGDDFQTFSFVFRGILSSRTFDIVGGDDRLNDFRIDVVDVPTIEMVLHCEFPAYMHRDPRDVPGTGLVQLPQGTKVTVDATANKDLVEVPIQMLLADKAVSLETVHFKAGPDRRKFSFTVPHLDQDQTLLFTLVDTDGIRSREPVRLLLGAQPDEPPKVALRLRGISTAVTPQARLPVEGDVTDDYGVAKLWFEYKVDQADAVRVPFQAAPRERTIMHFTRTPDEALDLKELKDLKLAVGQQLLVTPFAQDNCTLKGGPNVAPGEKYQLSVVSPEQLLTLLEARELTFRVRLDAIVQDVADTRDRLARLDLSPAKAAPRGEKGTPKSARSAGRIVQSFVFADNPAAVPAKVSPSATTPPAAEPPAKTTDKPAGKVPEKLAPGAEPGDVDTPAAHPSGAEPGDESGSPAWAARGLASPPVVVEQTMANSLQSASETDSLATAFDDIREEMLNNRVNTPELEYRLKDQIGDPLRRVAQKMFPELDIRLRTLQASLADPATSKLRRDEAVKQLDAILVEMRLVLNKMLELESFNEIVEQLRGIIELQNGLNKETQQKHKLKALKLND